MHLNDLQFNALRDLGHTGSTSDMLLQWLQDNGATSNNIIDAWREMLVANGYGDASRTDDWFAYLRSLGYEGALNDMELAFWKDGGSASSLLWSGTAHGQLDTPWQASGFGAVIEFSVIPGAMPALGQSHALLGTSVLQDYLSWSDSGSVSLRYKDVTGTARTISTPDSTFVTDQKAEGTIAYTPAAVFMEIGGGEYFSPFSPDISGLWNAVAAADAFSKKMRGVIKKLKLNNARPSQPLAVKQTSVGSLPDFEMTGGSVGFDYIHGVDNEVIIPGYLSVASGAPVTSANATNLKCDGYGGPLAPFFVGQHCRITFDTTGGILNEIRSTAGITNLSIKGNV